MHWFASIRWSAGFVAIAVLLAGVFLLLDSGPRRNEAARPNILLVSLCSVRADHMGCYGYRRDTTPGLDALAREAIVFERAITPWPKTVPAFASIVTGKYPHTTGVMRSTSNQRLADEHETLAEILQAHGYETGAFISTPVLGRQSNILQGCETVEEPWRDSGSPWGTATHAVAWLKQPRTKPFFAWVLFVNAHYPYHAPGAESDMFVGDEYYEGSRQVAVNSAGTLDLPVPSDHPFRRQILRADIGGVHPVARLKKRPHELDYYIARYDAGIYAADRMARHVLKTARRLGLFKNTIVAVVGDHGESLGEHNFFFEHGRFPYDTTAWVPLMIRPPGGGEQRRIPAPVEAFALAPTLLEMAGIERPDAMEADSLVGIVEDRREGGYVFSESGYQIDFNLSVRDARWKLIHIPNPVDRSLMTGSEYELYDMQNDPSEQNNLCDAEPEVAARLRGVLRQWSEPWIELAYRRPDQVASELDEATIEGMRSLGYLQ